MKSLLLFLGVTCLAIQLKTLSAAAVDDIVTVEKVENAEEVAIPLNITEDCLQPKETGRCFALIRRYAFNVEKRQCEEFIYGGCAGNPNNFESQADCEQKCLPALSDAAGTEASRADATTINPPAST